MDTGLFAAMLAAADPQRVRQLEALSAGQQLQDPASASTRLEFVGLLEPPPVWDEFAGQTIWLNPPICAFPLELDTSLADEFSPEAELHRGMLAALTQSLTPAQSAQIRQSLETSAAEVCTRIGITPDNLGQLVETNPLVAIDLLLRIMQTDNLLPYLEALYQLPMSLNSIEVVNRLNSSTQQPKHLLYQFITNCIRTCDTTADRSVQNRFVLLLCLFVQSMIRNGHIQVEEMVEELTSFAANYSRIKEAAALFKLLKTMAPDD